MGDIRNLICGLRYLEDLHTGQFSSGGARVSLRSGGSLWELTVVSLHGIHGCCCAVLGGGGGYLGIKQVGVEAEFAALPFCLQRVKLPGLGLGRWS